MVPVLPVTFSWSVKVLDPSTVTVLAVGETWLMVAADTGDATAITPPRARKKMVSKVAAFIESALTFMCAT